MKDNIADPSYALFSATLRVDPEGARPRAT